MTTPEISVVIPVFNEQDSVAILHQELSQALAQIGKEYELIWIDDGSTDETPERLMRLCAQDANMTVLTFSRNFGQTPGIQAGFDHCRGNIVITMDGDLQNDPADIEHLLAPIQQGYDVTAGWRRDRKDRAFTRRLPSLAANALIRLVSGVPIHDNGCTLRAYQSEVIKKTRIWAEMHRYLVPMLSLSGCRIKEIAVNHRERRYGESKYNLSRVWKVFLDLLAMKMLLRFVTHPAAWFAILSGPFVLAACVVGIMSLVGYAAVENGAGGPIVLPSITVVCVFAAGHLLLIGMFAELVVRFGDYHESDPIVTRIVTKERGP